MEEKTIPDWEKEKLGTSSQPTGRRRPDEVRTQSTGSRMLTKEQSIPVGPRLGAGSAEKEPETGSGQGPESDLDEESVEEENIEPATNNQGCRYPLRERRAPHRFLDEEHVLLIDERELESFEEAKRDTCRTRWISSMRTTHMT